jgi:hypothetical protein
MLQGIFLTTWGKQEIFCLYGTQRFITIFKKNSQIRTSWTEWVHSTSSHHISLCSSLILFYHLHLDSPRGIQTKIVYKCVLFYALRLNSAWCNNSIQFFIIYVPSQQPQGQLQAQHSVDKIIITWTDTT